jgi:hypothetical protein
MANHTGLSFLFSLVFPPIELCTRIQTNNSLVVLQQQTAQAALIGPTHFVLQIITVNATILIQQTCSEWFNMTNRFLFQSADDPTLGYMVRGSAV